ncbi:MAG TPA: HlyD family secretion protein [Candidatus Acidoferrum sp.]
MQETDFQSLSKEVRELKEEQRRLREEQDRLRRQAADSNGDRSSDEKQSSRSEGKSGQGHGKGLEGQQQKTEDSPHKQEKQKEENEEPKPPRKERARVFLRTHRKQVFIAIVIFVVLCIAAIFLILYLRSYESTDDAQVDGHLNAISTRVMGTVSRVYVEDNQTVAAGQLLVELDPRDFQNALDQAKANLSAAAAQLKAENPNVPIIETSNQSEITSSQSAVQNSDQAILAAEQEHQSRLAMLAEAEANNAKAQQDLLRYRGLVQKQEISQQQFDTYVATAKTEAAAVSAARSAADAAQKVVEQSRAQLLQSQARLEQATRNAPRNVTVRQAAVQARQAALLAAQAQTDQAALNLSYTKIFAPAAGIVTSKTVEVGERVEPGQQLLVVSQTEDIWITANFKETQLRKMHAGQRVDVRVDAYARKYHGHIESMPGATGARTSLLPPENATGNFVKVVQRLPVRIRLNNGEDPEHLLRPGMSVEPKVWLK